MDAATAGLTTGRWQGPAAERSAAGLPPLRVCGMDARSIASAAHREAP